MSEYRATYRGIEICVDVADGRYMPGWMVPPNSPGSRPYWGMASDYNGLPTRDDAVRKAQQTVDNYLTGEGAATFRSPLFAASHSGEFTGRETVWYSGRMFRIVAGNRGQFVAANPDDTQAVVFSNGDPGLVVFGPDATRRLIASVRGMVAIERESERESRQ